MKSTFVTVAFLAFSSLLASGMDDSPKKFSFGSAKAPAGFKRVDSTAVYSDGAGYGFEPGTTVVSSEQSITSDKPIYFSVAEPEGNYRVTATFGDKDSASINTVKAEIRRLMVEKVETAPGKFESRTFIVNVRTPVIAGGGEVRLKPREKTTEVIAWDNKLTLEFTNTHPALHSLEIEKITGIPTVYIAGDSTSTDQSGEPFSSWGQMLPRFFKPDIAIANHGESGESLRSYFGEKRFDKVMSLIRPGDYLLIQMGHNDQKDATPGAGAFTTYKDFLKQMVDAAKAKGATPVVITPMNRLTFDAEGKITNSLGDYPEAVRQVSKEDHVALVDLNAMSKPFYEALGPVEGHKAFAGSDTTHHSDYGSYELAKCVVQGLIDANVPLANFVVPDFKHFDPSHPDPIADFHIPAEPPRSTPKPYGN